MLLCKKMTHEKTWSAPLSPLVPKCARLFDHKAEVIDGKLNSRDFHVNFIFTVQAWEPSESQGARRALVPVVRSRSKSLFAPDQHLDRDKWGIPCRTPYLSFLFAASSPGGKKSFTSSPRWGWWSVRTSGCFQSRPRAPVWRYTITRRNTQCYPRWPNCLHVSVAFPGDVRNRKTLSNPNISQPTSLSYQPVEIYVENNVCY